ncbi:Hypothetical_protein [Hexamita inflata]|uniref:Hypothetical_protein n=1 Tax=Hexamita inflata TaxID=28002 RepID=A0AA86VNL4_9EUKA|nr:Hypothetical protein HINF_LOCUS59146 [Hexamita inflata]CAI9971502.1 Hypothetical protein HINF_LOCUS59147 [Hexamita inflata]CAI9971503.1 Hypothetical protein HINF_LOCUS59148 [Hexamita inflata]
MLCRQIWVQIFITYLSILINTENILAQLSEITLRNIKRISPCLKVTRSIDHQKALIKHEVIKNKLNRINERKQYVSVLQTSRDLIRQRNQQQARKTGYISSTTSCHGGWTIFHEYCNGIYWRYSQII